MEYPMLLEDAIQRFYLTGQNDAHQWLLQFQNSNEAWQYVWQLLNPTKPFEVQFFATNTLYTKISKQWFVLPKTEQEYVRNQLFCTVKQQNLHKAILNSLCQSVSALLANTNSVEKSVEDDETNACFIDDLVQIFPYNDPATLQYLLKTLIYLPAEIDKKNGLAKIKLRTSLVNSWPKILWLLIQIFTSCNGPVKDERSNFLYILGLECMSLWLNISQFPIEITDQIYPYLLQSCNRYLPNKQEEDEDSKGFNLALECLTTIIKNRGLNKHPTMLWKWAKAIVSLINEENKRYFYELLTEFGETHSRTLLLTLIDDTKVEEKAIVEKIIEYLLKCCDEKGRYPTDERYSALPFGFWYNFQDDVETLDKPQDKQTLQAIKPIYARLTMILLRKSELPLRPQDAGNADEREMFRCYRQDIADLYVYCHQVLENDFLIMIGRRMSTPPQGAPDHWAFIESSIFAFTSVSESARLIEMTYVKGILDLILTKIRYDDYPDQVLSSACNAIGSFSEWIGEHTTPWMEKCLRLLGTGLTKSSVTSSAASMALTDIVRECGTKLGPIAPSILDMVNRSIRVLNLSGNKGESCRLMLTASLLITQMQDHNLQLHYLEQILGYCILSLKQLIEESPQMDFCIKNHLKMIGVFVSHLSPLLVKQVFDVIVPVFHTSICNPVLMENPTIVEAIVESLHQCAPVTANSNLREAESLAEILMEVYKKRPHPKVFIVLKILVTLHGKNKSVVIEQVFVEMCMLTLGGVNACLAMNGSLSELCDILCTFFDMLAQITKKVPQFWYTKMPEQVGQILQLAMMCLTLPETSTVIAASYFYCNVITCDCSIPDTLGQELVCTVAECIVDKVILNNLRPHSDILCAMLKKMPQAYGQWVRNAIYNTTIPGVSDDDKDAFIRMITRHNTKERLFETCKAFGMLCRQSKVGLVHH